MPDRPRSTLSALLIAIAVGVLYIAWPSWSTTIDVVLLLAGTAVVAWYVGFMTINFLALSRRSRVASIVAAVTLWSVAASLAVYTRRLWPAVVLIFVEGIAVAAIEIRLKIGRRG